MQSGYEGSVTEADPGLNEKLRASAQKLSVPLIEGRTYSSDVFYYQPAEEGERPRWQIVLEDHDCLVVEMESFALFHNARITGKEGATLLTVSDLLFDFQETTAEEREKSFTQMMEVALGIL